MTSRWSVTAIIGVLSFVYSTGAFTLPTRINPSQRSSHENRIHTIRLFETDNNNNQNDGDKSAGRKRICIVGGGFGGLNAALTLDSIYSDPTMSASTAFQKPIITLLDSKERFVFLPLLYELCIDDASLEEVAPTYKSLLKGTDIEFVQTSLVGVDVAQNEIYVNNGEESQVAYDGLLLATGVKADTSGTPGADEHTVSFGSIEDCYALRKQLTLLDEAPTDSRVVVCGGGYTGVELALNLASRSKTTQPKKSSSSSSRYSITLCHRGSTILPNASEFNRNSALKRLTEAGVTVMTDTSVTSVTAGDGQKAVHIRDASSSASLPADLVVWTLGTQPSPGILNSILPRDLKNRIVTGSYCRVADTTNVFGIGDTCRASQTPLPANAQVAMQQASVAAWNLHATLQNQSSKDINEQTQLELLPFKYTDLGEMMTLGSEDATMTSLGGLVQLNGGVASLARRLVYAIRQPTNSQRALALLDGGVGKVLATKQKK